MSPTETNTAVTILFYLFAAMTVVSAIGVVASTNIVRTATWLFFALGAVAGIFFLLGADFLAAVQLIVYAGGTLVLIVFGVMLTAKNPFLRFNTTRREVVLAILACLLLFSAVGSAMLTTAWPTPEDPGHKGPTAELIGDAFLGEYLIPFELASVHLLVVLIGAAYMARRGKQ